MMTFAGPANSATPMRPSSNVAPRRRARGVRVLAGALTARSTWLSLTVIGRLLHPECENACFLILQRGVGGCQDGAMAQVRPYRGVEAAQRLADRRRQFIEAGLDLIGAPAENGALPELTVRAACRQAGVATRYFYEAFTDKDQFVGAVFDTVIAELAATTQAAVAAAPVAEQ